MHQPASFVENLKSDLPASLVVFLVATPLCLGIALASGAPLAAGLISGIIGGIVVGAASGSALGVSGPAAGLAVIVLTAIQDLGSFEAFLVAVALAGVIQIALGFAGAGVIGYYFPSSVIKGMLAGIGLTIILKQLPHAVGYDATPEGPLAFAPPGSENTVSGLAHMFASIQPGALVVALASLAALMLWERPAVRRARMSLWIQGPLVAVALGIGLNEFFRRVVPGLTIEPSHLVQIPTASELSRLATLRDLPRPLTSGTQRSTRRRSRSRWWPASRPSCAWKPPTRWTMKRVTPTDRELKAQGLGNLVAGLVGGLPVTQVIVRSSANVQSGARTKTSAVLHGVLLLLAVASVPALLNLIPLAALAAILLTVGYKLAKPAVFRSCIARGGTSSARSWSRSSASSRPTCSWASASG
ncbi:MAG: SulP family inorganic anion transporter [Vicinamibacterales bacterium]